MGYCVWYAYTRFTVEALAATTLGLHWSNIVIMLYELMVWLCYGYFMVMLQLLLWLLHQSGERLCYGAGASPERINLQFLWLLEFSSSFPTCSLPTLG